MKTIIVYYSMSGNVKQIAEAISEKTGADLLALAYYRTYGLPVSVSRCRIT